MKKLEGKVAIVTGGSGGIGKATVLYLAKLGANVVIHYSSNQERAENLKETIEAIGVKAITAKVDYLDRENVESQIKEMVKKAKDMFGRIDILVNLAGYPARDMWNKRALDYSIEDLEKIMRVDTYGTFLTIKYVAPEMMKRKKGVIVIVSSTPAIAGHNKGFGFTVAKAANIGLTKAFAFELSPYIRVNCIAPGNIETSWVSELSEEEIKEAEEESLLRRFGKPEDVAKVIGFLVSDDSSFVNGQTIVIDGGVILR